MIPRRRRQHVALIQGVSDGPDATAEAEGEKAGSDPSMRLADAGSDGVPNVVLVHDRMPHQPSSENLARPSAS
eukprot:scaffold18121_cov117-Isochrysis_galbana.AAC.1